MTEVTQFPDLGGRLSQRVIGAALEVHQTLGPGLLESIYEECLAIQMRKEGLFFERQKEIPVIYKGLKLDLFYKADFIVENQIILELKAVDKISPIHEAQLLTYLKIARISLGLIMNFNSILLKDGIKRMALSHDK